MKIPLILAGNFAELRSNHFHTGIDIKTGGVEGKNLYSIDDGYVSRMKISPWGYGKVIYIDHYNGFTSVYAHCSRFNSKLDSIMYHKMKASKVNELDAYFEKDEIKIKKGEMIGLSGNTGGSVAPHLHFEIRETKSERPLNPLLFNFKISDKRKPEIRGIKIYSLNENNYIIPGKSRYIAVELAGSRYRTKSKVELNEADFVVNGKVGIAVDVIDRLDGANNVCGIFETHLKMDGKNLYQFDFTKLDFSTNRKINGHTDVYEFKENRKDLHKLFSNPVTTLDNYSGKTNGIPIRDLKDSNRIEIIAKDQNNNTAYFETKLYFTRNAPLKYDLSDHILPNDVFAIRNENFELFLPPGTIFEPLKKDYAETKSKYSDLSPQFHFGNYKTPVNNKLKIRFKIPSSIQKDKVVICRYNSDKNSYYSLGGDINGDWIETYSKGLGDFFILSDTVAPTITPIKFQEGSNLSARSGIKVKIEDNLAGIKTYEVYLNDEFIPAYLTPKRSTIWVPFDRVSASGSASLKIVVTDAVGNSTTQTYKIKK